MKVTNILGCWNKKLKVFFVLLRLLANEAMMKAGYLKLVSLTAPAHLCTNARLLTDFGLPDLSQQHTQGNFANRWRTAEAAIERSRREGFNSLVILGVWIIWKQQNSCLFNNGGAISPAILTGC